MKLPKTPKVRWSEVGWGGVRAESKTHAPQIDSHHTSSDSNCKIDNTNDNDSRQCQLLLAITQPFHWRADSRQSLLPPSTAHTHIDEWVDGEAMDFLRHAFLMAYFRGQERQPTTGGCGRFIGALRWQIALNDFKLKNIVRMSCVNQIKIKSERNSRNSQ